MKKTTVPAVLCVLGVLAACAGTSEAGHYRARFNAFGAGYGVNYAPVQVIQPVQVVQPVQTFAAPAYGVGGACQTNALGVTSCNAPVQAFAPAFAAPGYAAPGCGVGVNYGVGVGVGYGGFNAVSYRARFNAFNNVHAFNNFNHGFNRFGAFNNFNRFNGVRLNAGRGVNLAIGRDVFGRRVFRLGVR